MHFVYKCHLYCITLEDSTRVRFISMTVHCGRSIFWVTHKGTTPFLETKQLGEWTSIAIYVLTALVRFAMLAVPN